MSKIPKIIHLCWLSGDPYPPTIARCIDSWNQVMPDYEIMLWDKLRFVNEIDNIVNIAPFSITVENSDLNDLLEFRYMLEGETASYAAKRATQEDIAQLEYYYEKMKEFRHDVNQFVDYDSMFHMQVAVATHNKLLMSTMMASKDSFENGIRLAMRESLTQNPRVIDVTIELHGKIIEAIKSGDYQTAYTAMREHISYVNLTVKYG